MNINETKQGTITVLQAQGRLDAESAPLAKQHLDAVVNSGGRQAVLDLSGLEYVSSAGLRVLLMGAKQMQQNQGKLVFAAPAPQVKEVLDMAGFSGILPVFDTTAAAVGSFNPQPSSEVAANPQNHLSLAEEIYLLALDDQRGELKHVSVSALDYALAAALLMDLALQDRIDTDQAGLKLISTAATGDPLLDSTIHELSRETKIQPTAFWLERLVTSSEDIKEKVLERLIAKGILKQEKRRILWVFEERRYPIVDDREIKEVRTRLRELILTEEIPDPRDAVLISLGRACWLLEDLLPAHEKERVQARIEALARLDLIGRETIRTIREIERFMATVTPIGMGII